MSFCPPWCSAHCWALVLSIVAMLFFLGSIVSPWYIWEVDDEGKETKTDYLFYWTGAEIYNSTRGSRHHHSEHTSRGWAEIGHKAKHYYMTSASLNIVGFVLSWSMVGLIILCILKSWKRGDPHSTFHYPNVRWVIFGMALFALVLSFLSWTVFFGFNKRLHCPEGISEPCHGFAGHRTYIYSLSGDKVHWMWGPSFGWIFAVITTPLLIAAMICIALIKTVRLEVIDVEETRRFYN